MSFSLGMSVRLGPGRKRPSGPLPPSAVGSVPDVFLSEGTGSRTRAMAPYFSGGGTYSLIGAPTGVSINSSPGVLTVNTATSGRMAQTTFTVRKTQGAATADQPCKLLSEYGSI